MELYQKQIKYSLFEEVPDYDFNPDGYTAVLIEDTGWMPEEKDIWTDKGCGPYTTSRTRWVEREERYVTIDALYTENAHPRRLEGERKQMELYWVSAIVQNKDNQKPWLLAMSEGEISLEKAMKVVGRVKENHTVLSVWVDTFDENNTKQTVFHECYIDAFGTVWPGKEG